MMCPDWERLETDEGKLGQVSRRSDKVRNVQESQDRFR
jgi:hypothetical protein